MKKLIFMVLVVSVLYDCKNKKCDCKHSERFNIESEQILEVDELLPKQNQNNKIILLLDSVSFSANVNAIYDSNLESVNIAPSQNQFQYFNYIAAFINSGIPDCYYKPYSFDLIDNGSDYTLKVTVCKKGPFCFPKYSSTLKVLIKTKKLVSKPINLSLVKV